MVWMPFPNTLLEAIFESCMWSMAFEAPIPYDRNEGNNPRESEMGAHMEDSAPSNGSTTLLATRRKTLLSAGLGLGFASLIRTQDVFSMAQDKDEAVHQVVSEHGRRESQQRPPSIYRAWYPITLAPTTTTLLSPKRRRIFSATTNGWRSTAGS